jgi:Tol biopolymer transport system component
MKRRSACFGVIGLLLTATLLGAFFQSGEDLFQKALRLERNEGKLLEAIELYTKVVAEGKNESLAAQAQLRIGLCYEKLGQKSAKQAQDAFQKVIDNFPGQTEAVKVAQEKLSNFLKAQSAVEKAEKEFNIHKVCSGPLTDYTGAPSSDGKYLTMVDWTTGDLAVRDIATGKIRRLTDKGSWAESTEFALFSRWSPDGKKIVYNWLNKEECFDLRIIEIDDPEPRILYPAEMMEYVHPFEWSPDGSSILVAVFDKDSIKLGLMAVADGSFRILKDFYEREWGGTPAVITFSPDGKYIAYDYPQDEDSQNCDIFLISIDGKRETHLINHPMNDTLLGWSPDGEWILFASNRTGTTDAWVVRVDNGKKIRAPEMIKKDLGQIKPLGFTRNGYFYYGISNQMTDIYSIEIDPESGKVKSPPAKAILRYEGSNMSPAYSEDGKFLGYISTRGLGPLRHNVLCIRNMQSGEEREINPELKNFGYPRWSPDKRFISVEVEDRNNRFSIHRIDVQTGAVDPIVEVDQVIYSHRWSKDGKSIFYTRSDPEEKGPNYSRSSHIYVHDILSGQEKVLSGSPSDAKDIDISPDGRWLVLLNRDEKRVLRIIPTSGGEPRDIHSFDQQLTLIISPTWIAGGKYILFYQTKPDLPGTETTCEMVRVPAKGGEIQRLGLEMKEFRHLSVHPDGQHIVFHSTGSKQRWPEVWVMENFLPKEKK